MQQWFFITLIKDNFMAKIKRTKNGNIQITMTEEQALAVCDLFGFTSFIGRQSTCRSFNSTWTRTKDDNYRVVYNLIHDELKRN